MMVDALLLYFHALRVAVCLYFCMARTLVEFSLHGNDPNFERIV